METTQDILNTKDDYSPSHEQSIFKHDSDDSPLFGFVDKVLMNMPQIPSESLEENLRVRSEILL